MVAKASLQRPIDNQILTTKAIFEFCQSEISGITTLFIPSSDINDIRDRMKDRYSNAKTVPGTRSYHEFVLLSINKLGLKRVSEQNDYTATFEFGNTTIQSHELQLKVSQFIACVYDDSPWIGTILEIDEANRDILVKFLHPPLPTRSFHWPEREDKCYIPDTNILSIVKPPVISTGRQYCLSDEDIADVTTKWQNFVK